MSRPKNYYITLDTETCPLTNLKKVDPYNMFTYDMGWGIHDRYGNIVKTRSFIVKEIYYGEQALMQSAYYANKLPQYDKDITNGIRQVASFYNIRQVLLNDIAEYKVKAIIAHNARFDYGTLQNTQRWLTKSKYRYFFPQGIEIWDTMKMAQDTICKLKKYRKFCEENDLMTKTNRIPSNAETLYKFITNNTDFSESHTALEDVLIEKEIFTKCVSMHKKMRRRLWDDWVPLFYIRTWRLRLPCLDVITSKVFCQVFTPNFQNFIFLPYITTDGKFYQAFHKLEATPQAGSDRRSQNFPKDPEAVSWENFPKQLKAGKAGVK